MCRKVSFLCVLNWKCYIYSTYKIHAYKNKDEVRKNKSVAAKCIIKGKNEPICHVHIILVRFTSVKTGENWQKAYIKDGTTKCAQKYTIYIKICLVDKSNVTKWKKMCNIACQKDESEAHI